MEDGVVQYLPDSEGHNCGYCKSKSSSFSKGMWAYSLPAQVYQDLIDRGWRRSGKYCYKPEMSRTCCPSYTIRCDALSFKPTKSHKKILKRVHKFLLNGRRNCDDGDNQITPEDDTDATRQETCQINEADICLSIATRFEEQMSCDVVRDDDPPAVMTDAHKAPGQTESTGEKKSEESKEDHTAAERHEGYAHNSSTTKKKTLRKQRWLEKQKTKELPLVPPVAKNAEKNLEEWLDLPSGKHSLEIRLVRTTPYGEQAERTTDASHAVYRRYQMKIHGDSEEKCALSNWKNFLVESPLMAQEEPLLGSFHQQYWLDDRLIAVGVLDLLPKCISSVYFYYDPEFEFLSMGTFASLCEINLTRKLHRTLPAMKYYYMGYYIHSCPKMRYKGRLPNSDLLCPEAYSWHPIQKCVPLLDGAKYSRLEPEKNICDPDKPSDISETLMLHRRRGTTLADLMRNKKIPRQTLTAIKEYSELVGSKTMKELYLYVK